MVWKPNSDGVYAVFTGSNHMYVFVNPKQGQLPADITWESAQKEIAQAKGFATESGAGLTKGWVLIPH